MSRSGSGVTWNCFWKPPMVFTSVTPGTVRSCGRMIQSCTVRRSIGVYGAPCAPTAPAFASTVHMKISPRPVAIGPSVGSRPGGSTARASWIFSLTSWRAK
jgi:hypothetical protein